MMNCDEEIRDAEIQEAIDLVSFGKPASVKCGNCGVYRTVGKIGSFPYMVETCRNCGDDEFDLLAEDNIP